MRDAFLPYGRQDIDDEDIAAVVAVLRGDWLTTGPTVEAFETAFAEAVGASERSEETVRGRPVSSLMIS